MIIKEIKKIIGIPFVIFFMSVLMFLNAYILAKNENIPESNEIVETVYAKIEGELTQEKVNYISENYLRLKNLYETRNYKTDGTDENTISGYVVEDYCVFLKCYEHVKYCLEYKDFIEELCINAKKNKQISNGKMQEAYYDKIISTYEGREIRNIADTDGNDMYLSYEYSYFFSICMIIIIGTYMIFYERENNMGNIIFTTLYGRYRLLSRKIIVMFIDSFLCAFIFRLEDYIIINYKYGFHGLLLPVYTSDAYRYSQFDFSYIDMYIFDYFSKVLVLSLIAIISLIIATKIRKSSLSIIVSVGIVFVMILSQIFIKVEYLPMYFQSCGYIQKFRCINLFGTYFYGYAVIIIAVMALICLGCIYLGLDMKRRNIYAEE